MTKSLRLLTPALPCPSARSVDKGYQRMGRCSGHSATIRAIDWSADSSIIMSNSNDGELLFWTARTAKQVSDTAGMSMQEPHAVMLRIVKLL